MTNHVSTFSHLFDKPPNYKLLRVFGSLCYLISGPITLTNLIFSPYRVFSSFIVPFTVGICLHQSTSHVYILRNVVFDETVFRFQSSSQPAHVSSPETHLPLTLVFLLLPPLYLCLHLTLLYDQISLFLPLLCLVLLLQCPILRFLTLVVLLRPLSLILITKFIVLSFTPMALCLGQPNGLT